MFKKLCDIFSGVTSTVISGIFLIISLILMITKTDVLVDPAWITVILSGYPLLYLAITRLFKQKWVSSCLLISIAMIASLSLGKIFAAGEVAFIIAVGAILEDKTVARAKKGLNRLLSLTPVTGRLLTKDSDKQTYKEDIVPLEKLHTGDLIRVLPGESIPCDGIIVTGKLM